MCVQKKAAEQIEMPAAELHVINYLILCRLCTTTVCQISYVLWKSNLFLSISGKGGFLLGMILLNLSAKEANILFPCRLTQVISELQKWKNGKEITSLISGERMYGFL